MNIALVKIEHIDEIIELGKKSIDELRKLNPERAYNGIGLTKNQLIYQIVFLMDAPDENKS